MTWHFLCFKIVSLIITFAEQLPVGQLADFPVISDYSRQGWFVMYFIVGLFLPLQFAKIKYLRWHLSSFWQSGLELTQGRATIIPIIQKVSLQKWCLSKNSDHAWICCGIIHKTKRSNRKIPWYGLERYQAGLSE